MSICVVGKAPLFIKYKVTQKLFLKTFKYFMFQMNQLKYFYCPFEEEWSKKIKLNIENQVEIYLELPSFMFQMFHLKMYQKFRFNVSVETGHSVCWQSR